LRIQTALFQRDIPYRASGRISYGNQALILQDRGRLEEAMALLDQKEEICRDLNLRNHLRIGLLNQADLFEAMGQPENAPPLRAEAAAIEAEIMRGRSANA